MKLRPLVRAGLTMLAVFATACPPVRAAEHITLRNGSEFDCTRQEPAGNRVRLYLVPTAGLAAPAEANYIEVPAGSVLTIETVPDPPPPTAAPGAPHLGVPGELARGGERLDSEMWVQKTATSSAAPLTPAEMGEMLARAGALHNIDTDLLASVVQAESNGNALAVSRAGARGLMQLMPATATDLGVRNSFAPEQNIGGGTAYLDQLLIRYDPNNDARGLELAVAAYNAGPAAVDRYHGIPPYAETRAYVARVIRAFNRRKLTAAANLSSMANAR
jgi:soluble lytic murein transglycosylase-like protein